MTCFTLCQTLLRTFLGGESPGTQTWSQKAWIRIPDQSLPGSVTLSNSLTSLGFGFFICEMGLVIVPKSQGPGKTG